MIARFDIEIPPQDLLLIDRMTPMAFLGAVAEGMNKATPEVLSRIVDERLTGEGPFPADQHRLGVVTGQLRASAYSTPAVIAGDTVSTIIGSPLRYAGLHEFGGTFTRTSKPGSVRLRTDRSGQLLMRGNLATFARKTHKLAKEVSYQGGKTYTVTYPARGAFGFGVADQADIFTEEISGAVLRNFNGGTP